MNYKRILLGGIVAGVVFNIVSVVLAKLFGMQQAWEDAYRRLGITMPTTTTAMVVEIGLGVIVGLFLAWDYAAMRPRFGAGVRTAVTVGMAGWAWFQGLPALLLWDIHMFPTNLIIKGMVIFGLIQMVIAAIVAGALYKETAAASSAHA